MSAILLDKQQHIATITLNQPELRNSISEIEVVDEFLNALTSIEKDQDIRCVIITGAGSAFSSGGNIKHMLNKEGMFEGEANDIRENYAKVIQRIPVALHNINIPTIAAVNGPAVGAGCDLAMYCDMRIASTKASFAESFIKVGLFLVMAALGFFLVSPATVVPRKWPLPVKPSVHSKPLNGAC